MRKALLIAASLLISTTAANAHQLIDATNPAAILKIARDYGSATLTTDSYGDPLITGKLKNPSSETSDFEYQIEFYNCDDDTNDNCEDILFEIDMSNSAEDPVGAVEMNHWNINQLFGMAVFEDDTPSLHQIVTLEHGVSAKNLDAWFSIWEDAVEDFDEYIHRDREL